MEGPGRMTWIFLFGLLTTVAGESFQTFFDEADEYLSERMNAELKSALTKGTRGDSAAASVFGFLDSTPYIKTVGYHALEQLAVIKKYKKKTGLSGDSLWKNLTRVFPDGMFDFCIKIPFLPDQLMGITNILQGRCCPFPEVQCFGLQKYRTLNGACNCPTNPDMGRSNRAYRRFVKPDYADGVNAPRAAKDGSPLPSAREVSNVIYQSVKNKFSGVLTVLHMTIGQLVDHDTDRTPVHKILTPDNKLVDLKCGDDGCDNTKPEDKECFPMHIPPNDPFFKKKCLKFVRSQAFMADNCKIGPREQANVLTSWIDASFVYGSTYEENEKIRDDNPARGKMKTQPNPVAPHCGPLLPNKDDPSCRDINKVVKCFLTGDARQNEQVALTAIHITAVRLHNKIEENLHRVNPHWDGDRLFQESRAILIALFQNIFYQEYLPPVLGPELMKKYKLNVRRKGCNRDYNCKKYNADVTNSFSTAAFRFGHSQIPDVMRLSNIDFTKYEDIPYSKVFFRPESLYKTHFDNTTCGVAAILLGQAAQRTDKADHFFSTQVTRHMFTDTPPGGMGTDLPAMSTQRGRDHGLPGYTKFREFCGLSVAKKFEDLKDIPQDARLKLAQLYKHVDDIDIFPGGMVETHIHGGIVGPTFACILAKSFQDIKLADRFWFEKCGNGGFSKAKIKNLRQYSLGSYYCDTLEDIQTIQRYPMMVSDREAMQNLGIKKSELIRLLPLYRYSSNERKPCSAHKTINFNLWKENRQSYLIKNPFPFSS